MNKENIFDKILVEPADIDLSFSPLRKTLKNCTYVMGAFNPGMSVLPDGNIILMVRIAEALKTPVQSSKMQCIRWDINKDYVVDTYDIKDIDSGDPRSFTLKNEQYEPVLALTSISWLLPVELSANGKKILKIHYDKIISPSKSYQEYGIEDARISLINGKYYMTTCSVSSERQCTVLYTSVNGLDYTLEGIILDHQNKDMLLFEGLVNNKFYALTRPLGQVYFATHQLSKYKPGTSIHLAESIDSLHWKPSDNTFIRIPKKQKKLIKIGGGSPPILTENGWLILFHGVEQFGNVGCYKTFWALADKNDPSKILHLEIKKPLLESRPELTRNLKESIYLENIVFTTGIVDFDPYYILASGELDLCTRITHIPKSRFLINQFGYRQ
ncbi:MAG: glycosidase [Bacteroidota bacterium]